MDAAKGGFNSLQSPSASSSSSIRDVSYSCGSCGYELNLCSSGRNTSAIGSKYGKSIKKGFISFFYIDESRFTQVDEVKCVPYFVSKNSWGFFSRNRKLLCRKCGNHIGNAYIDHHNNTTTDATSDFEMMSSSAATSSGSTKYDIRLRSLQPSSGHVGNSFAL